MKYIRKLKDSFPRIRLLIMKEIKSLHSVLSRLKCFWLMVILLGLVIILLGIMASPRIRWQFAIYVGGALIGFACSAFFSCKDQFLLRGCKDSVFLMQNNFLWPRAYQLDRVSINALGGVWHEIFHVSERMIKHIKRHFGKGKGSISLKDATLYQIDGQKSYYTILLNTRYGIPDLETVHRIWGNNAKSKGITIGELDSYIPGYDLVSIQYWPEKDRK